MGERSQIEVSMVTVRTLESFHGPTDMRIVYPIGYVAQAVPATGSPEAGYGPFTPGPWCWYHSRDWGDRPTRTRAGGSQ